MKRIFVLATIICCMCLAANAEVTISRTKYSGCTVVKRVDVDFFGTLTTYGLEINGKTILKPECEMTYNADLHLVAFTYVDDVMYRISVYSTDSGQCVYTGLWRANSRMPYVTYTNNGKYTNAVVNHTEYYDNGKTIVGQFYRKDGRTFMLSTKQVTYDKQL